ncbi:hypothetical protein, partial [Bacillus licheniformis]|uniref:hypothetical protein n=1 Tax=Bacillus licheniformis TaxID=1402 RepID=UPI001C531DB5
MSTDLTALYFFVIISPLAFVTQFRKNALYAVKQIKKLPALSRQFQLVDKVTKKWLDRQAFFVKMCVES